MVKLIQYSETFIITNKVKEKSYLKSFYWKNFLKDKE